MYLRYVGNHDVVSVPALGRTVRNGQAVEVPGETAEDRYALARNFLEQGWPDQPNYEAADGEAAAIVAEIAADAKAVADAKEAERLAAETAANAAEEEEEALEKRLADDLAAWKKAHPGETPGGAGETASETGSRRRKTGDSGTTEVQ